MNFDGMLPTSEALKVEVLLVSGEEEEEGEWLKLTQSQRGHGNSNSVCWPLLMMFFKANMILTKSKCINGMHIFRLKYDFPYLSSQLYRFDVCCRKVNMKKSKI